MKQLKKDSQTPQNVSEGQSEDRSGTESTLGKSQGQGRTQTNDVSIVPANPTSSQPSP
jgi:hypothetical protein